MGIHNISKYTSKWKAASSVFANQVFKSKVNFYEKTFIPGYWLYCSVADNVGKLK